MLLCPDKFAFCGKDVERTIGAGDDRWTLRSVKLFGDGALGSRGAALLEEYSDRPEWSGFLLADEGVWAPLIKDFYDDVSVAGCKADSAGMAGQRALYRRQGEPRYS